MLGLEARDLLVETLELRLRDRLALQRRAGEVLATRRSAARACWSSFGSSCSIFCVCSSRRFFAVTTSATPLLTFCSISSCFSYE